MKDFRSFAVHVIGGSHIKKGTVCQDHSGFYEDNNAHITIVADGHGDSTCFRSDLGSKFAVECAMEGIKNFIKFIDRYHEKPNGKSEVKLFGPNIYPARKKFENLLRDNLIKFIVASWNNRVLDHFSRNPFSKEELDSIDSEKYRTRYEDAQKIFNETGSTSEIVSKAYGATLIAAAMTNEYWFGFHIGDGRFTVLYKDGTGEQPVPWDEKCYLNVTTSISDNDILDREHGVRIYFSYNAEKEAPIAVYLCTDGIDDNYPVEESENRKQLVRLYRTISLAYADDGYDSTCKQLKELADNFAIKGKGDDTSVGLIINIPELQKVKSEWKINIEKAEKERERKRAEEAEKARLERVAFEKLDEIKRAADAAKAHEIAAEAAFKETENIVKAVVKAKKDFDTAWKLKKKELFIKAVSEANSKTKQAEIAEDNASDAAIAAQEAADCASDIVKEITAELNNTTSAATIKKAASDTAVSAKRTAVYAQKAKEQHEKTLVIVLAVNKVLIDAKEAAKSAETEPEEYHNHEESGKIPVSQAAHDTDDSFVYSNESVQRAKDAIHDYHEKEKKTNFDQKQAANAYKENNQKK